jgi:hypothetical protein
LVRPCRDVDKTSRADVIDVDPTHLPRSALLDLEIVKERYLKDVVELLEGPAIGGSSE